MDFTKTLLITIFTLSCLLAHTNAVRTPQARVWTICKPTTNPLLCFKTILPQILSAKRFNMYKAVEIEVLAAQKQVQKTAGVINALLAKPGNPKSLNDSLSTCKDQYSNMLDSISETIKVVAQRNAIEARFKFSAVLSYHASCNDDFGAGVTSPFADDAKLVYDLGGNCLDIMKAIEDRESRRRFAGGKVNPTTPTVPTPSGGPCRGVVGICMFN
ncbi:Pectinesterase inhibitor domain [Sesbania bispinosa]|nr:Pectinesterase inhibitor domain [Sesbania bispinosa]